MREMSAHFPPIFSLPSLLLLAAAGGVVGGGVRSVLLLLHQLLRPETLLSSSCHRKS